MTHMLKIRPQQAAVNVTIYEALRSKLGRDPTHVELKADVKRILDEALIFRAEKGKLRHQR